MNKVFAAGLCLFVAASSFAGDAKAPAFPEKNADGTVSTKKFLDFATHEMKPKMFPNDETLACFKLKRSNLDKVYNAAAKTCKAKILKQVPPVIKPPFELDRVAAPFGSCVEQAILKKRGVSQRQHYECMHPEQK